MIGTGSMSDPYMHCEADLHLMRRCLLVIKKYGFGVAVQTKSDRILMDIDLLSEINEASKCVVQMTLTTYDDDLCKILEPHVCNTKRRIEVLEEMNKRGIPTVVWLTPLLPFINDNEENVRPILEECSRVGVKGILCFDMVKERYMKNFGNAYIIPSPRSEELMKMFKCFCKENGIMHDPDEIFRYMHEFPEKYTQMSLWDL